MKIIPICAGWLMNWDCQHYWICEVRVFTLLYVNIDAGVPFSTKYEKD